MPSFDLSPDSWTEIVPSSSTKNQSIAINFGEALLVFGTPSATSKVILLGGAAQRSIIIPSAVAVNARGRGRVSTGDYSGTGGGVPTPATPLVANSVTYQGFTYRFFDAASGGSAKNVNIYTGAEGAPYVVADASTWFDTDKPASQVTGTFTGIHTNSDGSTTAGTFTSQAFWKDGMMKNPFLFDGAYIGSPGLGQGWDELFAYSDNAGGPGSASNTWWDTSKNIDPGFTGQRVQLTEGSYVKYQREPGVTVPQVSGTWRLPKEADGFSALHVGPAVPNVGFFCPAMSDLSKTPWLYVSDLDKTVLGTGFTLPSGKPNLATASPYFPTWLQPYFAQNGEARRRMMSIPGITDGYSRDYGQLFNDWFTAALVSPGSASATDADFYKAIAFAVQLIGMYNRGFVQRGGAGQNCGHKQFVQLLAQAAWRVPGLKAKCIAYEGNATHQQKIPQLADLGLAANFPDENHGYFMRPYGTEHLGRPHWRLGNVAIDAVATVEDDAQFATDYELTSEIANFGERNNIGALAAGSGPTDGFQTLLNGGSMASTNPYAAAIMYQDRLRAVPQTGIYPTDPYTVREAAYYDARRNASNVPRWITTPDDATEVEAVTAGASQFSWDYSTMAHDGGGSVTASETGYSMDGVLFYDAGTSPKTGLVPGWRYLTNRRRQNSAGWGPRSVITPRGRASVTVKATASVTANSNVLTISAVSGYSGAPPAIAVGNMVSGPGITPGTYIASLGTGTGTTGTYNMSAPAYEAATTQQYRLAPIHGSVIPTGTPSGPVVFSINPAICAATYEGYKGPLFSVVTDGASTVSGQLLTCSVGVATGAVQAPLYKWQRDTVDISSATAKSYRRANADGGKVLRCGVSLDGGSTYTYSAGLTIPGVAYPAFDLVEFDGTDYTTRSPAAVFTGAANSSKITIAMMVQMLSADATQRRLLTFGDASGTSGSDAVLLIERATSNRLTLNFRDAAAGVTYSATSAAGAANELTIADGETTLLISMDVVGGKYDIYLGGVAVTMATPTIGPATTFGIANIQRPNLFSSLGGTAIANARARYFFMHPDYIDLSVSGNRDKFLTANIGNQGEGVFGVPALCMWYGAAANWNAGKNWGTGGDFNMVGAVT